MIFSRSSGADGAARVALFLDDLSKLPTEQKAQQAYELLFREACLAILEIESFPMTNCCT